MGHDQHRHSVGSKLRSGFVNLDQPLTMRAEKSFADSAAALRLTSFEQARAMDSILETRLNRYAAIYAPAAAVCALLLGASITLNVINGGRFWNPFV